MRLSFDKQSFENLLLWNHRAKLNQPLIGWSLGDPLSKVCLAAVTGNWFKLQKCIYCKLEMAEIWNVAIWKYKCLAYICIFQVYL